MQSIFQNKGFSLIELMVVVAIIGVLTTIALPSYQQYLHRARFVEIVAATEPFKIAVALALQSGEEITELENGLQGIPEYASPSKNLENIAVKNGVITATASAQLNEATYILTPDEDGSVWHITGTCLTLGLCHA